MTTLRAILAHVADHAGCTLAGLRGRFNGDLTGLKVALERNLLAVRISSYVITAKGAAFLCNETLVAAETKTCPDCRSTLPAVMFWRATSSGDGLFPYCIRCANARKRKAMEERRSAAIEAVVRAGEDAAAAAILWDEGVAKLAAAWRMIMAADLVIIRARQAIGSEVDAGRLDARATYPRAAYAMNVALADARFPQVQPMLREVNLPARLVDWIGAEPHMDYLKDEEVRDALGKGLQPGAGEAAGVAEQGNAGAAGDGDDGADEGGRSEVPAPAGGRKSGRVPVAGRALPAKGHPGHHGF